MKYLVTGGCGFLGSNLSSKILKNGDSLSVFDNLYRKGSEENLKWLKSQGEFLFYNLDIRSNEQVEKVIADIRPDVIYHLVGQVAMTTSIENPRLDFDTNVLGGIHLLEAVRKYSPGSIIVYSSTNKVYGDLEYVEYHEAPTRYIAKGYEHGFCENVKLDFRSPYGCSKGATDQYMLDYSRIFGLKTVVFRHSSIFGGRQFSTEDQGWIGWFVQKAIETSRGQLRTPFTICGNGKQVRDVLFVDDLLNCYFNAVANIKITAGSAYNIGGGSQNSLSLLELFELLEKELDIQLKYEAKPWRQSDQKVFIADIRKAKEDFGWKPNLDTVTGLKNMIQWVETYV